MSALQNKINSLNPELSFEFNEPYSLNPTLTGTAYTAYSPRLIKSGNNLVTFESNVGPIGGAGSWAVPNNSALTGGNTFRTSGTSMNSTWVDGDYSTGVWIMISNMPDYSGDHQVWRMGPNSSSAGFAVWINYNSTTNIARFKTDIYTGAPLFGPTNLETNRWYFLALRKSTASNTAQVYLDGTLVLTGNNPYSSTSNYLSFGTATALGNWTFNVSNWYCTTYSGITGTQIQEIWLAGSTKRIVKYYDGTAWQTSSAQKVFNGTSWVDWTVNKYDGTNWVSI